MPFFRQAVILPGGDIVGAREAAASQGASGGLVGAEIKVTLSAEKEHHGLRDVHAMVAHRLESIQYP